MADATTQTVEPPPPTPSEGTDAKADAPADEELICTLCGLRACWQKPA